MQVRLRQMWIATTLAVATGSALVTSAAWYARGRIELPDLPAGPPVAPAHGRTLFRPGERVWHLQLRTSASFTNAFERGLAAYNADDPDTAVDAFEEAVRLAPDDAEAHINLGLVYLRLRRADDGLRELHEGARLEQRAAGRPADGRQDDATIRNGIRP